MKPSRKMPWNDVVRPFFSDPPKRRAAMALALPSVPSVKVAHAEGLGRRINSDSETTI